ncbi:MAG: hypothetical protein H8E76_04770 [Helicobacteraceae bacterium]|nr:hypothetical protein [Candidatus Sulfurimonas ponti]MBL6973426.1 hypothetical protein [Sulfurimonas sp.]
MKKIVISLLLFSFAFILVHDYVICENHLETPYTQVENSSLNADTEVFSDLHESIHSLIMHNMNAITLVDVESVYQKELEIKDFFISQIVSVLQRPPLI